MARGLREVATVFIEQLSNAGSLPVVEAAMRFAAQRQKLIAHNIANFETPNFHSVDVSPKSFQAALGEAVRDRRRESGGAHGDLDIGRTSEIEQVRGGGLVLRPQSSVGGVLAHDRNGSDLERTMQAMVENAAAFRVAADLFRARSGLVKNAIAERVA
jgi:flagellar basal-body rod protein FlgB